MMNDPLARVQEIASRQTQLGDPQEDRKQIKDLAHAIISLLGALDARMNRINVEHTRVLSAVGRLSRRIDEANPSSATNGAKGSGAPLSDEEKASYIAKREAGLSSAEAAKRVGKA